MLLPIEPMYMQVVSQLMFYTYTQYYGICL